MKQLILFITLCLSISAFVQAQNHPCGTEATQKDLDQYFAIPFEQRALTPMPENNYTVPLKVNFVSANANTRSISMIQFMNALCHLNKTYDTIGMSFYINGDINYIYNANFNPLPSFAVGNSMADNFNIPGNANIYITNLSQMSTPLCGFASLPNTQGAPGPGPAATKGLVVLSASCTSDQDQTWAHEFGHYFSLLHPFQTTSNAPASVAAERVTRNPNEVSPRQSANCQTAGDGFCDTQADYISTRWNCATVHTQVDLNGDVFTPTKELIMGYAEDACTDRFSQQQKSALINSLTTQRFSLAQTNGPTINNSNFAAATLLTPASGSVNNPANHVAFSWSAVPGATKYVLEINSNSQFSPTNPSAIDLVVDYAPNAQNNIVFTYTGNRLLNGTTYFWRVKAFADGRYCGATSLGRNFRAAAPFGVNVQNLSDGNRVNIYPTVLEKNSQNLRLSFEQINNKAYNIQVLDLNGRVQFDKNLLVNQGETLEEVSLSNLSAGIYLVKIQNNTSVSTQKITIY